MKIVFQQTNDRYIQCLASAAASIWNNDVILWNRDIKPTLDMISQIQPDVVFVRYIDQNLAQELAFGKQKHQYKLVGIGQQTHQLFDYVSDPIPCINVAQINKGEFKEEFESPLSIIVGPNYGLNPLKPVILDYLENNMIDHKIYGMNEVYCSLTNYMGAITPRQRADIIASSKIFIDWSQQYGFMDALWFNTQTLVFGDQDYGSSINGLFKRYSSIDDFIKCLEKAKDDAFSEKIYPVVDETSYRHLANILKEIEVENIILEKIENKNEEFNHNVGNY